MSVHELHPEELFDRSEAGTLSASDKTLLDKHLATCAACRFEMKVRDDFRLGDEMDGEGGFSERELDAIIGASLRGSQMPKKARPRRSFVAGRRWGVLLAAAMLLVSAQAAARWLGVHGPAWLAPHESLRDTSSHMVGSPTASEASHAEPVANGPVTVPTMTSPVATSEPVDPSTVATPAPSSLPLDVQPKTTVPLTPGSLRSETFAPRPSASTMFAQANGDRVLGKHVVAADEYRALLEKFPSAPEADLARASLGRLLLDDGDAAAALPYFDAYLQRGGPLREEAMVNRAVALERLHREAEESTAWKALLDAYPDSMNADHARDRLKELGAR